MSKFLKIVFVCLLVVCGIDRFFAYYDNRYLSSVPRESKRVVVIGASSGIGKSLAQLLSAQGYTVGLTARRIELLHTLQKTLPSQSYCRRMDLRQPKEAQEALQSLIAEMGGLDFIVINAGVGFFDTDLDWEHQKETLEVNVVGFAAMANVALKHFVQQNYGHIVGISSVAAIRPGTEGFTYGATKAFESAFLTGLRNTLRVKKMPIVVTDIQPGFVKTDMVAGIENRIWESSPEEAAQQIYDAIVVRKEHAYITKRWRLLAWVMKFAPNWLMDRIS